MELVQINHNSSPYIINRDVAYEEATIISSTTQSRQPIFIEANTKDVSLYHLKNECITPVFSKDNEVTISHNNFIESVWESTQKLFRNERISEPDIRVSHIIKGRTPDAIHKSVNELTESDKTIYYERMAFCIEIPSITETINGNALNLTIGGVRAYNQENLYSKKSFEKFKLFIGFKNLVCCNMCVSTDGCYDEVRVSSSEELMAKIIELVVSYNAKRHLEQMRNLLNYSITESQFAQFIGKARLYQFLPQLQKRALPDMLMTDTQINLVARAYYQDENFAVHDIGSDISLWNTYNLLTGANKSSHIDNFLSRSVNATNLSAGLTKALDGKVDYKWFLE